MNKTAALLIMVTAIIILNNCSSNPTLTEIEGQKQFTEMEIKKAEGILRQKVTDISSNDMNTLVQGNIKFAFDMYAQMVAIKENLGKNVFFSPYSISVALAMTLAGAEGETETEMHSAMRFALAEPDLHRAFNQLEMDMESAARQQANLTLSVVNSLWGQYDYSFHLSFLDMLAANYGSGMNLVDFRKR
ncbi:MAG: serpin family protein [Chitinispirillia bacterium]|jgi:serpin B